MSIFDRFTEGARRAMVLAQECAKKLNHNYVGSEHLLAGLLCERDGAAAKALMRFGVTESDVMNAVSLIPNASVRQFTDSFGYTPSTKKILEMSLYEAKELKNSYIGTEHILLAIINERGCAAAHVLSELGVDLNMLRKAVV